MEGLAKRLALLRERYYLLAGPLLLILGVSAGKATALTWVAGALLALLTLNWLVGFLMRELAPRD